MELFNFTPASQPKRKTDTDERVASVSQITRRIKNLLEDGIGAVWVEGEVSNHRKQTSGHH